MGDLIWQGRAKDKIGYVIGLGSHLMVSLVKVGRGLLSSELESTVWCRLGFIFVFLTILSGVDGAIAVIAISELLYNLAIRL